MVAELEVLHVKPDACMAAETAVTYTAVFLKEMSYTNSRISLSTHCKLSGECHQNPSKLGKGNFPRPNLSWPLAKEDAPAEAKSHAFLPAARNCGARHLHISAAMALVRSSPTGEQNQWNALRELLSLLFYACVLRVSPAEVMQLSGTCMFARDVVGVCWRTMLLVIASAQGGRLLCRGGSECA